MYSRIENNFNKKSKNRRYKLFFVISVFVFATTLSLLLNFFTNKNNETMFIIFSVVSMFVFYLACYAVIIIKVAKFEKITFSKIIDFDEMKNKYHEIIHKEDIKILKSVLKENGVNTRPKILEALRHYQALLPRKIVGSGQLISVLALTISAIALMLSETVFKCKNGINNNWNGNIRLFSYLYNRKKLF